MVKSVDEEYAKFSVFREMAVGVSHLYGFAVVTSELMGRKTVHSLVEPIRDCCVNAQELLDSKSGSFTAI